MKTRSRTIALAVTTVALFAAGCGGSDEESTAPAASESAPPSEDPAVDIVDFEFEPATLTVEAGTEVTFTNDDTSPHTATADDDSFDTDKLDDRGGVGSVQLDEPGSYPYFCEFHPTMRGTVEVVE